jgi:hypothetical protein
MKGLEALHMDPRVHASKLSIRPAALWPLVASQPPTRWEGSCLTLTGQIMRQMRYLALALGLAAGRVAATPLGFDVESLQNFRGHGVSPELA